MTAQSEAALETGLIETLKQMDYEFVQIADWLRNRYTIEFLGTWEMIHNPYFKVVEFDHFKMQAGLPNFVLSVSEWIEKTGAIGIMVKKGKYGGTYAFRNIAFEFGSAIIPNRGI